MTDDWRTANDPSRPVPAAPTSPTRPEPLSLGGTRRNTPYFLYILLGAVVVATALLASTRFEVGPRIAFLAQNPPKGYEESSTPLGTPPPVPVSGTTEFVFSKTQADGISPVTWSPCRPIHYVVRPANAPANGDLIIQQAIERVSAATGLTFINDGPTDEAPSSPRDYYQRAKYGDRWAPVLIAWATDSELSTFAENPEVAGSAGPAEVTTDSGDSTYVSGVVYLKAATLSEVASMYGQHAARAIVMHELGHLVGLDHVGNPMEIMWPNGHASGLSEYQPGDRAGLAALGAGSCQDDI